MTRLTVTSLDDAISGHLEADAKLLRTGLEKGLSALGAALRDRIRENIEKGGRPLAAQGIRWPDLHPATLKIREFFGHNTRPLIRDGSLLRSIAIFRARRGTVEVGTRRRGAGLVNAGGKVPGTNRTLPARPFALPAAADHDAFLNILLDHIVPEN